MGGRSGAFFFSSRRRHTRCSRDWSSDVCSSDLVWRRGAQAAVMVSGNGCAHVYFRPRGGPPTPRSGAAVPSDLVEQLLGLPAVQLGAWRDGHGDVVVASGWQRACVGVDADGVHYEPLLGDPLGLGPARISLDDRELLARSRRTAFPDAPRQLVQLFSSARTGDVVLAAARGSDFREAWEIPEHRAGHGSLIADHMEVPLAASVPLPDAPIRTVDLMRSEEHTSELQSRLHLVCRLLLEKKKQHN